MRQILIALLILITAVTGLAMTARAQQQEPPPGESASSESVLEGTELEPPAAEPVVSEPPMSQPVAPSPGAANCPPDRLVVKVKPGADAAATIGRQGGTIIQTIPSIEVHVVLVPHGTGPQAIAALSADPDVQYAEPDGVVRIASGSGGC